MSILSVLLGWGLGFLSLYLPTLGFGDSYKLFAPLLCLGLGLLVLTFGVVLGIGMAFSVDRSSSDFQLYLVDAMLSLLPLGYFLWRFLHHRGTLDQFMLDWVSAG
ncbi:MAG: hypothetical protein HY319_13650 [Armatimonadetes bacterium]|nr:hypothetical protein [Armatimonadota bacterium]